MFRVIVGVLAAFVGFSFGHSIPKWMECRSKSATDVRSPSSSTGSGEPAQHRLRKHCFRRKSLRKFKFGLHRTSNDTSTETNTSTEKLCKVDDDDDVDDAAVDAYSLHGEIKCVKNAPVSVRACLIKDKKKLKFGSQKLMKDESRSERSNERADSAINKLVPAEKLDRDSRFVAKALCVSSENACDRQRKALTAMDASSCSEPRQDVEMQAKVASRCKSLPNEPVISIHAASLRSACSAQKKLQEEEEQNGQVKQWKMKLRSLRSKAMASEKVWYEKFENAEESCGGKLLVSSPMMMATQKSAKGKENESPLVIMSSNNSSSKKDFFWRRSSSRVGLLVDTPKSSFDR